MTEPNRPETALTSLEGLKACAADVKKHLTKLVKLAKSIVGDSLAQENSGTLIDTVISGEACPPRVMVNIPVDPAS